MATIKINVMSIVAIIVTISAIIAAALLESVDYRGIVELLKYLDYTNAYLAMLIIAIILALVVLIVTCLDVESATGKTFLIYALASLLLLAGIICFAVQMNKCDGIKYSILKIIFSYKIPNEHYASIVFGCVALIASIAGTIAPFVCNK